MLAISRDTPLLADYASVLESAHVQVGKTIGAFMIGNYCMVPQFIRPIDITQHTPTIPEVAYVGIMETVTSIFTMHTCYHYLITHYLDLEALNNTVWSTAMYAVSTALVMIAVQGFFARRIWLLDARYRPIVVIACLMSAVELAFYVATTAEIFKSGTISGFKRIAWLLSTGATLALSMDLLLTAVLIYLLHCSRTGMKRTDSAIDTIILYAVSTGLLTGVLHVLATLFGYILPSDFFHATFDIPATKMYANSLLTALNSRQHLASFYVAPTTFCHSRTSE
ncbi:hypothetical protein C8Q79DRAFT_1015241 [Trametes meyenii]|nr:hypothetical protein C8Q79DRAFT_1015241 [Trametes meyenii]